MPQHIDSPDPTVTATTITETGALSCSSGSRTGRVPKDKRIVLDAETKDVSTILNSKDIQQDPHNVLILESSLGRG